MDPNIHYARTSDDVNIAYFAIGAGSPLVYIPPGGDAGQAWQIPEVRTWSEGLAANRRLIRIDYRGIGLSDRGWSFDPWLTARDVEAVAEKEGLGRFALYGGLHTAATAIVFAANHPDAVSHLVLWGPYANSRETIDSSPALKAALAAGEKDRQTLFDLIGLEASGWSDNEQARRFAAYVRDGASPDQYLEFADFDIRPLLSGVTAPVLVLHRREAPFPTLDQAKEVASGVRQSRFELLEGRELLPPFGDIEAVLAAIQDFLAEDRDERRPAGLTRREIEILSLVAGGKSNSEIAATLTLSTRTVERHLGNIYLKIGARNRADATAYAFRHALAPLA